MTSSIARMLTAAVVLAVTFFGGYLLGGGRNMLGAHRVRGESDPLTLPGLDENPGARVGTAMPLREGQFGEIKRQPWTKERLLKAARGLLDGGNELASIRPISHFADQLEAGDFPLAFEISKDLTDQDRRDVYVYLMLLRWAELNPRAAAEFLTSKNAPDGSFGRSEAEVVFGNWARTDASGAAAWARGLTNENQRKRALEQIARTVATHDPDGALAFVQTQAPELLENGALPKSVVQVWEMRPPSEAAQRLAAANRPEELFSPTREWAKTNRADALAWAEKLTEPKQRESALQGVYSAWAEKDTAGAAASFAKLENPGGQLGHAGENIVGQWPVQDLKSAQIWVQALPAGEARDLATAMLASRWGQVDPAATQKWMEGLPEGAARDKAIGNFATVFREKDRAGAMTWTLSIGDTKQRATAFKGMAQDWFQNDPAAALDWMQSDNEIPAEEKQELLRAK